jgi:hypothetical protein
MGLRFRRRISLFPGVHLNVSGKGVSVSLGVPGANINLAPGRRPVLTTGIPGTGISFQQTLGDDVEPSPPPPQPQYIPEPSPTPHFQPWERGAYAKRSIESREVSSLTSASLAEVKDMLIAAKEERAYLVSEANELRRALSSAKSKLGFLRFFLWRWAFKEKIVKAIEMVAEAEADLRAGEEALAQHGVNLNWTLTDDCKRRYDQVVETFKAAANCQIIWDIIHETHVDRVIARSAASRTIDRKSVHFSFGRPDIMPLFPEDPYPKVPKLQNANGADIYIFPGFLLLEGPSDFAIVEPGTLDVTAMTTSFVEDDRVPGDSQVVGQTWQYVNKNGTPDRRYASNRAIPIASYGSLAMKTLTGFDEEYQFSNPVSGLGFAMAIRDWAMYMRSAP